MSLCSVQFQLFFNYNFYFRSFMPLNIQESEHYKYIVDIIVVTIISATRINYLTPCTPVKLLSMFWWCFCHFCVCLHNN